MSEKVVFTVIRSERATRLGKCQLVGEKVTICTTVFQRREEFIFYSSGSKEKL